MAEPRRVIERIRDFIRRDPRLRYEDFQDIVAEAERTGDHRAFRVAYLDRLWQVDFRDISGMSEAERAAEAERRRQNALEEARELEAQGKHIAARCKQGLARILDFDPKQPVGEYYSRFYCVPLETFDHDEESSIGPMRHTDTVYQSEPNYDLLLSDAVNIISVKIASLDVSFPIQVFGTVIARDSLDQKCLYLFRRDRKHPQLINSEDESLILTGPKRGIALLSDNCVEIDLKIKGRHGQGRELSKGYVTIKGIANRPSREKCTVESESLATRLSTVDVMYAVVRRAVEATISIEVLRGDFYGKITAYTTSVRNNLLVHDSKLAGVTASYGEGVIQLMRPVVSVRLYDMLYIVIGTGDGKSERTIEFTPRLNNVEEDEIVVGSIKMRVKVAWSIIYP